MVIDDEKLKNVCETVGGHPLAIDLAIQLIHYGEAPHEIVRKFIDFKDRSEELSHRLLDEIFKGGSRLAPPHAAFNYAPVVAIGYIIFSNGFSDNRLFKKPSENKATASRSSPIESGKRKLLQVGIANGQELLNLGAYQESIASSDLRLDGRPA